MQSKIIITGFLLAVFCQSFAQPYPCFEELRNKGRLLFQKQQYEDAIYNYYLPAFFCDSLPNEHDLTTLIRQALDARLQELAEERDKSQQLAAENLQLAAKYLILKALEALQQDNPRLVMRLLQEALDRDPTNDVALKLYHNILPNFLSQTISDVYPENFHFSPDGKYFSFFSNPNFLTKSSLNNLMEFDSKEIIKVKENAYFQSHYCVEDFGAPFTTDSKGFFLLLNGEEDNGAFILEFLNIETNEKKRFESVICSNNNAPRWNKNGETLSFLQKDPSRLNAYSLVGVNAIDLLSSTGLFNGEEDPYLKYSPDRAHVLYQSNYNSDLQTVSLHALNLIDGEADSMANTYFGFHHFSPGNGQIVYLTDYSSKSQNQQANLNIFDLDTRTTTTTESFYFQLGQHFPKFDPGSQYIYFISEMDGAEKNGTVKIKRLDSSVEHTLENVALVPNAYQMSPDGERFFYFVDRDSSNGAVSLYAYDLESRLSKEFAVPAFGNIQFILKPEIPKEYVLYFTDYDTRLGHGILNILNRETGDIRTLPKVSLFHCEYAQNSKSFLFLQEDTNDNTFDLVSLRLDDSKMEQNPAIIHSNSSKIYKRAGKYLAFLSYEANGSNELHIWDLETERLLHSFTGVSSDFRISPSGNKMAFLDEKEGNITIWDLKKNELQRHIQHQHPVIDIGFSPDESFLVSTSLPNKINANGILKITDLSISQNQLLEHYDQFYLPLSPNEKKEYGLPENQNE